MRIVTADLSQFGYRELEIAKELLEGYINAKTDLDIGEGLTLNFNTHSGYVFLSDSDYRVYMINDDNDLLEEWFSCSICGFEGFKEDVKQIDNHSEKECKRWIKEVLQ